MLANERTTQPFDVLLVEDDPADANLVRLAFKANSLHCQLHHVGDGVEGLAFLRRGGERFANAPRPDLILVDLNMPRMNGSEFLDQVKKDEVLKSIPVVVLTTSDVEKDITTSYELGAAGFITKPTGMPQFIAAMKVVEGYWFATVRLPRTQG